MEAPKRIGLVFNGLGQCRLWARDEVGMGGVNEPDAEYILAAEHERLLSEARNNALEDAARMVDCACECRDAVLAAKTKVERWNACGRDPCGPLEAAEIRALKESPGA